MPPFDNVQYQNDSTPTFSVEKLNFSAAQVDYSHTSLAPSNVSAAAQNNTNNTIASNDTSHTTYSGDNSPASYQANSPLNNSDLNQHRHENSDEYLTSASALSIGDHGNSTSDEPSTVNLLNMDSHYNSNNYYANSNSTSGYEDGKFLFDYLSKGYFIPGRSCFYTME